MFHNKKNKKTNIETEENFVPKAFQKAKNPHQLKEEQVEKNNKNIKNKKDKFNNLKKKVKIKKFILIIVLILIVLFGINLGISTHRWKCLAKEMTSNTNSKVIDTFNNEIATLGNEKKHIPLDFETVQSNLKNAYIAIEDERFYSHNGVDIKRTVAAIGSYIVHFGSSSYGGSTITQQLVKNLTGDSTDNITRKIKEWWKAVQLETCLSKDEILDAYLDIIYVGPNMYGVETGAKYYFNKAVNELSLEECCFLAGINNSPNSYNPFSNSDNSEKIKSRTKTVLAKMLELNYINKNDYDDAIKNIDNGLNFKKGEIQSSNAIYSYHTDALILDITKDIQKKYNISETFATNYINMAGLTIKSTQDSSVQNKMEEEFEKSKYQIPSKISNDYSQAAMVIIDQKTGYIVGCTGGLGEKNTSRSLNRATQSIRQTGSAIKPLSVLAPAIDKKIITAASIFDDTEQDFDGGYHPTDYSASLGKITVRRAVESSQNIPFVEIMKKLNPKNAIKYLEKMGVSTLTSDDNTLVLSLGGLQKGISPLEMAGAYATIANDGQYIEPLFYSEILNKDNQSIIKPHQEKRQVFSKEVAYILKELLTQPVIGNSGTATYCKISGIDVAAKTGTTDENYDRWLCGFTPYYTAVTWYGYDQNESVQYNKKNPAGLIWANVMSRVHTGLNGAKFEQPAAITTATICSKTGKRATSGCTNTYMEYFLWFTTPDLCDEHTGSEFKETKEEVNKKNSNITEIVKGITEDIDVEELHESTNINSSSNNNKITNAINSTNTNINSTKNNDLANKTNTSNSANTTNETNKVNSINSNTTVNKVENTINNTNTNINLTQNVTDNLH